MKSFKIFVFVKGNFVKLICGEFSSKRKAKQWTLDAHERLGLKLNPAEVIVKPV